MQPDPRYEGNTKKIGEMKNIAIIGAGNIGLSLARGLVKTGKYMAEEVLITRRDVRALDELKKEGFGATADNALAFKSAEIIVLAVLPQQLNQLLDQVRDLVDPQKHLLVSVISGVSTKDIQERLGSTLPWFGPCPIPRLPLEHP